MRENLLFAAVIAGATAGLSCGDPVHDVEVAALGGEAPGVPHGPTHRPGQPCLTCHGGLGPASAEFVTAGTVYMGIYSTGSADGGILASTIYPPLVGGNVHLVDANGLPFDALTNTVGNFYVTSAQWNAAFPLGGPGTTQNITVGTNPTNAIPMTSHMGRGGGYASCSYCHFDPPGPTSAGHIYF